MRTKSSILMWLLSLAAVLGLCMSVNSCQPEGLVDDSEFSLYYPGISDIGPSSIISVTPTWHGATPNNFEIYKVTLDGNPFTEGIDAFKVDPESGMVTLSETENLPVGKYTLSIACSANGKRYEYPDIIAVNMMKSIPEGITVEPNHLEVQLADIISGTNLPSAQITTDGDHITIKKYLIAGVRKDGEEIQNVKNLFALSENGKFTIKGKNDDFIPGLYEVDFKLTTSVVGEQSEEGIFTNALTLDVTSEPLALTYTPSEGLVEAGYEFQSPAPAVTGSSAELKYEITSVNPACPELSIDGSTGALSFKAGNTLNIGDKYEVDIKVSNKYGSKVFEKAYKMEVVKFITPISKVSYGNVDKVIQTCSFTNNLIECDGDNVIYSFKNLPEALKGLQINAETGVITGPKKNNFAVGLHNVTVVAKNTKGEKETTFTINIVENPYMFTYVSWGNNIGLKPAKDYASQHRLYKDDKDIKLEIVDSDIPEGQTPRFEFVKAHCKAKVSMDEQTGALTVSFSSGRNIDFVAVRVTVGEGEPTVSKLIPIFFNHSYAAPDTKHTLEYTPFAIQINPVKGGRGGVPKILDEGGNVVDNSELRIDLRRTFEYYNLNGPATHITGRVDKTDPCFLKDLWDNYGSDVGAKDPVSYYKNKNNLAKALCYINEGDGAIVVNPNKFIGKDGIPANGVFTGQAPFGIGGEKKEPNDKVNQVFSFAIWFDTQFE